MAQFAWTVRCPQCTAAVGEACWYTSAKGLVMCERRIEAAQAEGRPGDGAVTGIRCACGVQRCRADPEVKVGGPFGIERPSLWVERPQPKKVTPTLTPYEHEKSSFEPSKLRACRSCRTIYVLTMYEEQRLPERPYVFVPETGR